MWEKPKEPAIEKLAERVKETEAVLLYSNPDMNTPELCTLRNQAALMRALYYLRIGREIE